MGSVTCSRGRIIISAICVCVLIAVVGISCWFLKPETETSKKDTVNPQAVKGTDESPTEATTTTRPLTRRCTPFIAEPWKHLRLPCYTTPTHYDVFLYPDFYEEKAEFTGEVAVAINITHDTRYLLIHIKKLKITETSVTSQSKELLVKNTFYYVENQFWVTEMESIIKDGRVVTLKLSFQGSLKDGIVGFYKSTYTNSKTGEKRSLATSKFEPVDARKAFPCFDEPNIKATYTVTLRHKDDYMALSNMPVQDKQVHADGLIDTHFQKSVPMSTYLVCFIVCDFKYKEKTTKHGTPIRVYATADKIDQVDYALAIGQHIMDYFEDYFNMSYPLPKQAASKLLPDMIAIPDFVSGAMEHWGLITYREVNLLFNDKEASDGNKQRVAAVVSHELAHQWFGNIVTMDWWDDLWLNEGFASFMEYKGVDSYEQDWQMEDQMVTEDIQPVMQIDSKLSSHPIVVDVERPEQITEVFDSISYSKGASVIRMLEAFMGKDDFRRGVEKYLKQYEYKNARTDDLWAALDTIWKPVNVGITIKTIMDTWTRQMGFPVVHITFNGSKIIAEQRRFLSSKTATSDATSPYNYKWCIPLRYISSSNKIISQTWMNKDSVEITSPVAMSDPKTWIKFNVRQTGFYRVNYPEQIWRKFACLLENDHTVFSTSDRAGLIDDAFNLVKVGYVNYGTALNLTRYLKNEKEYLPWASAESALYYISSRLLYTPNFGAWRNYIISLVKPVLEEIGWRDDDSHLDRYLRSVLVGLDCWHGDRDCLLNASSIFKNWITNNSVWMPPNFRSFAYRYGMQSSSVREWDIMWGKYQKEIVPQERVKLLLGLSQIRHPWVLHRYLQYAKDENLVRSQDFFTVLIYVSRNHIGRPIVWNWIRSNWLYLVSRFGLDHRYLGRLVPSVVSGFNTDFQLKQVRAFFTKHPNAGSGARGRKQAVETIQSNIGWIKTYRSDVVQWLSL